MDQSKENRVVQGDEIDLIELTKTIWLEKIQIIKITGACLLVGLIIAFVSPVEYEASCKLLPETQEGQMANFGGLAGLAGLAGMDLSQMADMNSGVLTPELYPEIVYSLPFILKVMNDTIYFEGEGLKTTSFDYFKSKNESSLGNKILKYTLGLPALIKEKLVDKPSKAEKMSEFQRVTKDDLKIIDKFKDRINIGINDKTGIINIMVSMPDAYAAAQLAKKIELMITEEVTVYKTEKATRNLNFVEETYREAKSEFESIQLKLAKANDRNRNVSSAIGQIELKKIEHEYDVAFNVYKGLASQVEQAKITLKEETPVFTILEPVWLPEYKSKPRRLFITALSVVLGIVAGVGVVLFRSSALGLQFLQNK